MKVLSDREYEAARNALIEPAYKRAATKCSPKDKGAFCRAFMREMTLAAAIEDIARVENVALFDMKFIKGV